MCGIAGIISLSGEPHRHFPALQRMAGAMIHRGPDDAGYLVADHGPAPVRVYGDPSPGAGERPELAYLPANPATLARDTPGSVMMAHRRLAILDLSAGGHQPMCTPDRRFWIVYNGEIFNFREVARELGIPLATGSDTEVLLAAYQRWGVDALARFNGMFAFAIWDDQEKTLFCARDRIGEKPFYYCRVDGLLLFASDIRSLIAGGLYQPAVHLEGLYHAIGFGVAPRPLTCFQDVQALEQAHWLTLDRLGRVTRGRYWEIPTGRKLSDLTATQALEQFGETLRQAVQRRLVADVPVGTFLSGGIDSSLITALAAAEHPGIRAFTLAFSSDPALNEVDQARGTAAMLQVDHVIREIDLEPDLAMIAEMIEGYEEPFYDLSPNYLMAKVVAANGVKVILNGLGGDELMAGYPYYRWLPRWRLLQLLLPGLRWAGRLPVVGHLSQRLAAIGACRHPDQFATSVRHFWPDTEKHRLFRDPSTRDWETIATLRRLYVGPEREFSDPQEAMSYIDFMNYIGNHHVHRVDKFTMRFSLESRLPFLDHTVVEAAFALPTRFKLHQGESKWLLRRLASGRIDPGCFTMRKKGFDLPTNRWMRGPLRQLVDQALTRLMDRGLFNPEAIRLAVHQWERRQRSFRGVWQLVAVELWLGQFIDRNPQDGLLPPPPWLHPPGHPS